MFSRKSKDTAAVPQPVTPQAPSNGPKRARALSAPSIISADMVINGTLNSTGDIQIDGRIEGDVRSVGLIIGEKAEIHGEVYAEDVTVRGKVVGRIRARKVLLAATSHVEGNCRHSENPLGEGVDGAAQKPRTAAASPSAMFAPLSPVTN